MNDIKKFFEGREDRINSYQDKDELMKSAKDFGIQTIKTEYSYNFSWMGLPIIQYPQDIVAMQELIFGVKPDLIIETGIARGGSLVFYSSILELLGGNGEVLGIDVDIRSHNYEQIVSHSMAKRITMLEGSSISEQILDKVKAFASKKKNIMVVLDSNHTHEHVLRELELYAPLVSKGSYCVVFDTIVEDMPDDMFPDRSWGVGNNPKTAVWEFLKIHEEFEIDKSIDYKLLISASPDGYLKRVS